MRKAIAAIATYRDNWIYELQIINCKGDYITLIGFDPIDVKHPYIDRNYKGMIASIINIAKANGYNIAKKKLFGHDFWNISLINLDDPKGTITSVITD